MQATARNSEEIGPRAKRPWWAWGCRADLTPTDRRNLRRFNVWLLGWALGVAVTMVALGKHLVPAGAAAYAVALAPTVLGVMAVASYVRFLRTADELLRKVQLEALAVAFGTGLVFLYGYRLLERAGAPRLDLADAAVVMLVTWAGAQWWGLRRYR